MKLNELIDKIKDFEGFRANAYYDSGGTVTIGYGRIGGVSITDKTTREVEDIWLKCKVEDLYKKVKVVLTQHGYILTENQYLALTDFAYNLGLGRIETLTANYKRTVEEISSAILLYDKCKGKTLLGLTKRRKWEHELFNSDVASTQQREIKKEELVATVQTKVNENISKYGLAIEPLVVDGIVGRKTLLALINVLSR